MNSYQAEQWRQVTVMCLFAVNLLALLALLFGVGWWVWDYFVSNPLPYRDPEAIEAAATMRLG
jgi:hypothetical protein